ncbi:uncharacterized protein EDB91DRAFT_1090489 [Suillus paluster]|uniref:uncharacterized protein n=1 Tax=Suillus paluster TaxID=48578 RepID=UPI001B872B88|nr:uncharacterized protein EDB91DRAFT_1090489 [Suillus paluster]KAG1717903.1 hypothetical protein EDB91DRAFT_1090489 [Suillus paluster]
MPDYFNDWWKESLGSCRVSDMLPKSSIKDVMDLVEFHCSQLGPDPLPDTTGSTSLVQCHKTPIGRELLDMLQGRMNNFRSSSDRLAGLVGPIDELTRAVASSQALIDRLNTDHLVNMLYYYMLLSYSLQYMVAIPLDWALYQTYLAGELVHEIFMSTIHQRPAKNMNLGLLDIDTCIALEHLANVMASAYSNADMVRYNDALDKDESGRSAKREQTLFDRFPPEQEHFLTTPAVIVDSGGRIIVWYLPGAMAAMMMLSRTYITARYAWCNAFHE